MDMITVDVLLFSVLKEKIGKESIQYDLEEPFTCQHLIDRLAFDYKPISEYKRVIRLAVNESYVAASQKLEEGDNVALITPVSGG